jgi:hypothetical protein
VQEVAKLDALTLVGSFYEFLTKHGGQQHEVVIVHPDQVVILDVAGGFCIFPCEPAG